MAEKIVVQLDAETARHVIEEVWFARQARDNALEKLALVEGMLRVQGCDLRGTQQAILGGGSRDPVNALTAALNRSVDEHEKRQLDAEHPRSVAMRFFRSGTAKDRADLLRGLEGAIAELDDEPAREAGAPGA